MDIFRPWDVAGGIGEVYIYHHIHSSLRSRLVRVVVRGRGNWELQVDRSNPLVIDKRKPLALVQ